MVRLARGEVFGLDEVVIGHLFDRTCRYCFLLGDAEMSEENFENWISSQPSRALVRESAATTLRSRS